MHDTTLSPGVNNLMLGKFCFAMIGRTNIEGSESNITMNAWLSQVSYFCGNFSDTSGLKHAKDQRIDKSRFHILYV